MAHWTQGPNADAIRAKIAEKAREQHARQRADGYVPKRGWKHSDETRERMSAAVRQRDLSGVANPFYGRTHSAATRALIAASNQGRSHPQSTETRRKISEAISGPKHRLWGTGNGPYAAGFTKKLKALIKERDGFACRECGKTPTGARGLHVHHLDGDKANHDPANLLTLCAGCHLKAHR